MTFGEVEYTPLTQGEGYIEFILSDNGTATINVDGSRFMSFEVEGNVVPDGFPTRIEALLFKSSSDVKNRLILQDVKCINYPYMVDDEYSTILFRFGSNTSPITDDDPNNWSCDNGEFTTFTYDNNQIKCRITPTDSDQPIVIKYLGFIVAVANYTTN